MNILKQYRHVVATLNHFERYLQSNYYISVIEFLILVDLSMESSTWTSLLFEYNLTSGKISDIITSLRARKLITTDSTRTHFKYSRAKYLIVTDKAKEMIEELYAKGMVPTFIINE